MWRDASPEPVAVLQHCNTAPWHVPQRTRDPEAHGPVHRVVHLPQPLQHLFVKAAAAPRGVEAWGWGRGGKQHAWVGRLEFAATCWL